MMWLRWYLFVVALTTLDCVLIVQGRYLAAGAAIVVTGYVLAKGRLG
jgi:hypothetical protein